MTRLQLCAWMGAASMLAAGAAHASEGTEGPPREGPAWAKPGQCFAKVVSQEVFETVPERQLVTPGRIERRLVPAQFDWRERTVVTTPAHVEHYPVPPTFRAVTEVVVDRPASVRIEVIPPVYETVRRQVLVREARTVWKPGRALPAYGAHGWAPEGYGADWRGQTQVTPTGEVMCLVYEPALYRDVVEEVVRTPERRIEVPIPAVTHLETRQVVDRPGYEASREIPATYGHVREKVLVSPEHEESTTIEPVYRTVETRRLVSPARTDWREIACAAPPAPPPPPPPPPCLAACRPPPPPMCGHACAPRVRPAPVRHWRPHVVARPATHVRKHYRLAPAPCGVCAAPVYAPPAEPVAEAAPEPRMAPDGRPMVARLQAALAGRGLYRGPVDGRFTAPTRDALVAFQREKGLAGEGQLTRDTARELGLRPLGRRP